VAVKPAARTIDSSLRLSPREINATSSHLCLPAMIRLDCVPEQSVTVHTAETSAEVETRCTIGFLNKLLPCHP
jgi:hypothetical protein